MDLQSNLLRRSVGLIRRPIDRSLCRYARIQDSTASSLASMTLLWTQLTSSEVLASWSRPTTECGGWCIWPCRKPLHEQPPPSCTTRSFCHHREVPLPTISSVDVLSECRGCQGDERPGEKIIDEGRDQHGADGGRAQGACDGRDWHRRRNPRHYKYGTDQGLQAQSVEAGESQ